MMTLGGRLVLCVAIALVAAGCSGTRQVEKDLKITDVRTGWYDAGVVNGQNKLVPTITLALQNISGEPIARVQVYAIFRRVNEPESWGDRFVSAIGPDALEPGVVGNSLVLRSERGYTGDESRIDMLQNRAFVDAKVEIFGKHGSRTWVKMAEYPIERHLLTE